MSRHSRAAYNDGQYCSASEEQLPSTPGFIGAPDAADYNNDNPRASHSDWQLPVFGAYCGGPFPSPLSPGSILTPCYRLFPFDDLDIDDLDMGVRRRLRSPPYYTADAATQTEAGDFPARPAFCPCVGCGRRVRPLPMAKEKPAPDPFSFLRQANFMPGREPCSFPGSNVPGGRRVFDKAPGAERKLKIEKRLRALQICVSPNYTSPPPFPNDDDDDHQLLSPMGHRRSVQEVLAQARDLLLQAILDTPRIMRGTSVPTVLASSHPEREASSLPPPPPPANIRPRTTRPNWESFHALSIGNILGAVGAILDSLDYGEDIPGSRGARSYIVSEELHTVYKRIEARWSDVCDEIKAHTNLAYDWYLVDCHCLLDVLPDDYQQEQLREGMKAGWRRLTADLREKYSEACQAFNEWRTRYAERELRAACSALRRGDRFRLLAALLRYELMESLPKLEKRTQERAVAFWKELTEKREGDVDRLFASDSE